MACWRKRPDCGGLPPWSASTRLGGLKTKDQKAERAVVHALGPAVGDRPGEASGVGASEDLGSRARVISKRTGLAPL